MGWWQSKCNVLAGVFDCQFTVSLSVCGCVVVLLCGCVVVGGGGSGGQVRLLLFRGDCNDLDSTTQR
jgi:hypothetical protein